MNFQRIKKIAVLYLPFIICVGFFVAYSVLIIVKHNHFLTGYDLAVNDQAIWQYSQLKNPINTVIAYYNTPLYFDHFEPIYALISPIYLLINDVRTLFVAQVLAVIAASYAMYLLALRKKVIFPVALSILFVFLTFYGIQNALWSDVHSTVFAIPFLAWFIYFLEVKKLKLAIPFFALAMVCKEDMALFTFLISLIQFYFTRDKKLLLFAVGSVAYIFFVFYIFFPYFADGYRFQNEGGLLSNLNINNLYNTNDKRESVFYAFASYGFIPLLAPIYLILFLADIAHYFVLGSNYVSSAQGLFLHYRSTLALFLAWPTIIAISKFKKLNKTWVAIYLAVCVLIVQYFLHLPLSYFSKSWFWREATAVSDIRKGIEKLPQDASVVTQVNIAPHITHRDRIYILWPMEKEFKSNSPCEKKVCKWFRVGGSVKYMLVDTSNNWDARYWLENREDFIEGVANLEKAKLISPVFKSGETTLYKVQGKI